MKKSRRPRQAQVVNIEVTEAQREFPGWCAINTEASGWVQGISQLFLDIVERPGQLS